MAMAVKVFSEYPPDVMMQAVEKITFTNERPTLKYIRESCDEIYEPSRRKEERAQRERDRKRALPPPRHKRTPEEQARIDAMVADAREKFGISQEGVVKPQQAAPVVNDGGHFNRIRDELERRKLLNDGTAAP